MSGLPREILKWMQSLDLSYSVKNVKRDFANGFLVAEILSRYHKGDAIVSLHSFDNGLGLVKRVQNWALLEKAFRKLNFPIERSLIDQVIHCKKDAAIPLMEQLYTLLTHKTVQAVRPAKELEQVPAFARPTASQLIKERMQEADLAQEEKLDQSLAPAKAAAVLAQHMRALKLEREIDPARFQPKPAAAAGMTAAASATKTRRGASSGDVTTFKEVQVRQLDDKGAVLQMRAQHAYGLSPTRPQQQEQQHFGASGTQSTDASLSSTAGGPQSPSYATQARASGQSALQLLSGALLSALGGPDSPEGAQLLSVCSHASPATEPIIAWVNEGEALRLPDAHLAHVLGQLAAHTVAPLAELSLANPKEFWQVSGVLFSLLDALSPTTQSFPALLSLLSSFGVRMVSRDPVASSAMFFDFAVGKYVAVLRGNARKVFQTARLAYAFVADSPAEHGRLIRALHEALIGQQASEEGQRTFFAAVAALAPFEGPLLVANEFQLLKSYLKLVDGGLTAGQSPRTRATALSILAPLAANPAFDERIMRRLLDTVRGLLPTPSRPHGRVERAQAAAEEKQAGEDGVGADEFSAPSSPRRIRARPLAGDEWLLDAELLHVISCALSQPQVLSSPELVGELHDWAELLLTADGAPYPTLRAGLAHLTHVLGSQPPLRRVWMNRIVDDDALRARVLLTDAAAAAAAAGSADAEASAAERPVLEEDEPSPELSESFCPRLRSVWHPLTVAQSLADQVRVAGLENLSIGHLELLAAATEDAFGVQEDERAIAAGAVPSGPVIGAGAFPDAEAADWCALFGSLRDYLVVELCDPTLCEHVGAVLRRFLLDARTTATAQAIFLPVALDQQQQAASATAQSSAAAALPPLYWIMRFMFPSADDDAQMGLAGLLDDLSRWPHLVALVHRVLLVFADTEADKFAQSTLGPLLNKLNQLAAQAGVAQH